jgi:hypothetical protein
MEAAGLFLDNARNNKKAEKTKFSHSNNYWIKVNSETINYNKKFNVKFVYLFSMVAFLAIRTDYS